MGSARPEEEAADPLSRAHRVGEAGESDHADVMAKGDSDLCCMYGARARALLAPVEGEPGEGRPLQSERNGCPSTYSIPHAMLYIFLLQQRGRLPDKCEARLPSASGVAQRRQGAKASFTL